jgi:hypothetical protein
LTPRNSWRKVGHPIPLALSRSNVLRAARRSSRRMLRFLRNCIATLRHCQHKLQFAMTGQPPRRFRPPLLHQDRTKADNGMFGVTECRNSKQCAPAKHHFDECVERVTNQQAEGGAKEDCVEECMLPPCFPPGGPCVCLFADSILHHTQSSTSPTARPSAPPPSFGPSSNKSVPAHPDAPVPRSTIRASIPSGHRSQRFLYCIHGVHRWRLFL